ncbi:MAG: hypothetical protein ACC634_05205 [Hyphomicrobiales bacterium]
MTSLTTTAAALQLSVYRTQGRPQGSGAAGVGKDLVGKVAAGRFEVSDKPLAESSDATSASRTVVASTESVRIELSNAARAALLELQTLGAAPVSSPSLAQPLPAGAGVSNAESAPLRQWASAPYIAPGSRLNVSI